MRPFVPCFLLLFAFLRSAGQSQGLADAVVELKRAEYEIVSLKKTVLKYHYRILICNEDGAVHGDIGIYSDHTSRLVSFSGGVYDLRGKKIRGLSKADLSTVSSYNEYSLHTDGKVSKASVRSAGYPYRVEYEYVEEFDCFPGVYWSLPDNYDLPVKQAELAVISPKGFEYSFRTHRFPGTRDTAEDERTRTSTWRASDIRAIPDEDLAPDLFDLVPSVIISPAEFVYEGTHAVNDSWENYGRWVWSLLEGRDLLPEESVAKIRRMTDTLSDTLEKIRCLYKYLQSTTRYVSIQEGIGGLQPAPAAVVDECKYGDCKGLSNYLRAMLAAIGVKAVYAETGCGPTRRIKWDDLPGVIQTNHVILAVPFRNDTLWLECTNNSYPFGYIGSGSAGRKAVCITEEGGSIGVTTRYRPEENIQVLTAVVRVKEDGSMECDARYEKSGLLMDDLIHLKSLDRKGQEKRILEKFPSVDPEIGEYRITETGDPLPHLVFGIRLSERSFATGTGSLLTFRPAYLDLFTNVLRSGETRETEIVIPYGFTKTDTVRYLLPEGFRPEYLPGDQDFESSFGTYHAGYSFSGNELLYTRTFISREGEYPAEKGSELNDFLNRIQVADEMKVVMGRKAGE